MASSTEDATTSGNIFQNDNPIILACNRQLATVLPVRMAYVSGGYLAGQVIARNTTSGFYEKYNDSASSGLNTAAGILWEAVTPASASTMLARGIFTGQVYKGKLTGLDANGEVDLAARTVTDATGVQILMF